ncbi:MAG: DNA primase [Paramuribaculum sp.]|nr:DNA primase [Paramuribaculum sp.]
MVRIDEATKQKIIDAADIVDVVSDYVRLKRRGSGYIGLCPFHNERTPSFSVSKSKGMCKCFSCGKGGGPVSFIMEIEQVNFPDALKILAKKYGIEIEERELTPEEKKAASERESILALNEYALQQFERNLTKTQEGVNIGLAYFRERGINDAMIKRFRLGYALEDRDSFYKKAISAGYNPEFLEKTGLCIKNERDEWRDRFRERVIFPIFSLSGKVIAFGGRTLRTDKSLAKYVNSPESSVYKKNRELYGIYQAKVAISKKDKCILVEGYMDVISMHQAGIENVVASSGTSLTTGQINLIHRFTENITVIYDSDPAGIKASLRGIDMLLADGMKVKVLLLPEGEDPDSFSQSHSASEVEQYIAENESDFVQFKTRVLLDGTETDPIARSRAITDIVNTIAVIPDMILRTIYIGECARTLGINETQLTLQVNKQMAQRIEKDSKEKEREKRLRNTGLKSEETADPSTEPDNTPSSRTTSAPQTQENPLEPYEKEILRYAIKYGAMPLGNLLDDDGNLSPMNVIDYIRHEMANDAIEFISPHYRLTFQTAVETINDNWTTDFDAFNEGLRKKLSRIRQEGENDIRVTAKDMAEIKRKETELNQKIEETSKNLTAEFSEMYLAKILTSADADIVRQIATDLVNTKYTLSKIHTKYSKVETERDRLADLVPMAIFNLKGAIIRQRILSIQKQIRDLYASPQLDIDAIKPLLTEQKELEDMKKELARYLGERTIVPRT